MSEALFSSHWHQVRDLKPQLRQHVELHRNEYRGLIWYILEDKAGGRSHRFNSTAYQVIGLFDGQRTVGQIWNGLNERLPELGLTQEQVIGLLGKLHHGDLLQSDLSPDTEELFRRGKQHKANKVRQHFGNPLSIKIPLWNPESFLQRHLSKVCWLFSKKVALLWALLMGVAGLLTAVNWQAISLYFDLNALSPDNVLIVVAIYPPIKFLHELGHAFSARHQGGEVHEMGITFLLFMPIPYVDVSSTSFLRDKYRRIQVSAAGILVELSIAAIGLFLWLSAEPGLVKDIAFNMMMIGGISSLFFNGNPLLKYDGYYILADMIAIPNLFQRSAQYLAYLCQKYLFGAESLPSPATASGEPVWFVCYRISSFMYSLAVIWFIVVYVTDTFFIVGVLLALWLLGRQLLLPVLKGLLFVFNSPVIERQRSRAIVSLAVATLVFLGILFGWPVPAYTRSEGVVWMPEESQLRAEVDGFAENLLKDLPETVEKDTPVVKIHDPLLDGKVKLLSARLLELDARFRAEWDIDRIRAENAKEEMRVVAEELKQAKKRQQSMQIVSKKAGKLLIPQAEDLTGRFVRKGEIIGYVMDETLPTVRVIVTQSDMGLVQTGVKAVEIRLSNHPRQTIPAGIVRKAPEATNYLPSAALATIHGGKIAVDPDSKGGLKTREKVFQLELEFSSLANNYEIGQRVHVRFDHGSEPLGWQWYRRFRQVFLRQFNV